MKNKNQKIKCNVDTCKFNNYDEKLCSLSEIKVGCDCDKANNKCDTICSSFEKEKG